MEMGKMKHAGKRKKMRNETEGRDENKNGGMKVKK